ncbi:hypothetical protein VAE151_630784 [Vibrio aestuarianus]|uniref:Uncharacterized protein n=1 Tax=Vibrio aestuarianus TaxID=28171 RepID=A0ABN8TMU2_9VIBR|nr:hypothetical protein VAE063_1010256 [Vibrio aestuarianus]CAH8227965.1 exported hypothetical protein [Vibrio aestuarianus subsp. francensis]CAH8225070.1 hypothetical protein VAE308_1270136 [Vibrio aestuarianus]CAH8229328.1 exported hypothetical protein [Vibrio aestuarianus]CAH8229747.1 hypothetical protein VAE032_330258 [Vibrio aestuarianus]
MSLGFASILISWAFASGSVDSLVTLLRKTFPQTQLISATEHLL